MMNNRIKNKVMATAGNSGRPVSRELIADDITVAVMQMPDDRWVAYPDYTTPESARLLPYQMPLHVTEQGAIDFATASIQAAQNNVADAMTLGDAIKELASRVSSVRGNFDFSARAVWAAKILDIHRAADERIASLEISTEDITERCGQGTQTLVITVSVVSLYGERRAYAIREHDVDWRNVSSGGRMREERYVLS